jgi:hypothetical protein
VLLYAAKHAFRATAGSAAGATVLDVWAAVDGVAYCYNAMQTAQSALLHHCTGMPTATDALRLGAAYATGESDFMRQLTAAHASSSVQPSAACTAEVMALLQQLLPLVAALHRKEGSVSCRGSRTSTAADTSNSSSSSIQGSVSQGSAGQRVAHGNSAQNPAPDGMDEFATAPGALKLGCEVLEVLAGHSLSTFSSLQQTPAAPTHTAPAPGTAPGRGSSSGVSRLAGNPKSSSKQLSARAFLVYASQACSAGGMRAC